MGRYVHTKEVIDPTKAIKYTYYPEYDGDMVTLEQAYKFYDENDLIHLYVDGVVKCYQEFVNMEPDDYEMGDLILIDNI